MQTEFADLSSPSNLSQTGHLSLDYSCIKWLPLKKKKKKNAPSLLVLGTASGDVLALDVTVGELKWRVSDCHPGGVNAVSCNSQSSCVYSVGVDGMVCKIDSFSGNVLERFKASTKGISSMAVSYDGNMLATAAAQLKVFTCSDNKKIHKFSGHTVAVRCMIFTEDGRYLLSSAVGERYIAIWKVDSSKKQSASCVLSMEHPAVFLHSKCIDNENTNDVGLYVLAISESGLCYFWFGKDIEDLRNAKPTKISLFSEEQGVKGHKGVLPMIFSAEIQGIVKPGSVHVLFAYGSHIKPSFDKKMVQYGVDITLNSSQVGFLLPAGQSQKSTKTKGIQTQITALDRGNAEDALLPNPKIHDSHGKKKRRRHSSTDLEDVMAVDLVGKSRAMPMDTRDEEKDEEWDSATVCMEEQLRSLGILNNKDEPSLEDSRIINKLALERTLFEEGTVEAIPQKKIKLAIKTMPSHDAYKLLTVLVAMWKSRSASGEHALPWICSILVYHSDYVISQQTASEILNSLYKMVETKCAVLKPLLQLAGRMQLIKAQIDKAGLEQTQTPSLDDQLDEDESEDEEVDEVVYREEEDDSLSSDDDGN